MRSGARDMMALRWSAVCLGLRRRSRSLVGRRESRKFKSVWGGGSFAGGEGRGGNWEGGWESAKRDFWGLYVQRRVKGIVSHGGGSCIGEARRPGSSRGWR